MIDQTRQPELDFTPRVERLGDELAARVQELMGVLAGRGWVKARELAAAGFSDRELRELVEHSHGEVFSYPGSPGYKILAEVTKEEFDHHQALISQGKKMIQRGVQYRRAWNRRAGA